MKKLGFFLKLRRNQLMIFQEEAANRIGISRVHYSWMENDKVYSYDPRTLKAVADFLGKPTDWVLGKIPKKPKE